MYCTVLFLWPEIMTLKLVGSLTSPFVRKVRVALLEKAMSFEFVPEDVWSAETGIQSINPVGRVPALLIDDGAAVFDSAVITETLDLLSTDHPLIPATVRDRIDARVLEAMGDGLAEAGVAMLLEGRFHEGDKKSGPWLERQQGKIIKTCAALNQRLSQQPASQPYLQAHYSVGDIAVGCGLLYLDFRFPQLDWRSANPALAAYAARLATRPAFEATRPPV